MKDVYKRQAQNLPGKIAAHVKHTAKKRQLVYRNRYKQKDIFPALSLHPEFPDNQNKHDKKHFNDTCKQRCGYMQLIQDI